MHVLTLGLPKGVSASLKAERFVDTRAEDMDDLLSLAEIDSRTRSYRFEAVMLYIGSQIIGRLYPHQVSLTGFKKPIVTLYDPGSHGEGECTQWYKAGSAQVIPYRGNAGQVTAALWSLIRLMNNHKKCKLDFGDLIIDTEYKEVTIRGELIRLKQYEYELLEFLAVRNGRGARREEILWRLYGAKPTEDEPEIKIVDVWACKLRKIFGKHELRDVAIDTDWGRGYRLSRRMLPANLHALPY